ncbi:MULTISPECIES: hypothetical protein [unclassified Thioalkalivibrio]|uniref:hypothetical protein n=1 Tax=unclassified Thioalkalivibrio TaxID=2621013 RepID=UPI0003782698|nr:MULTISPECIES: hypothetical protein [unclassified Thioalkalivibrio]
MKAGSSHISGTLGLRPLRAAPAQRAPGAFERHCLWLGANMVMRSVLTFASRMEPLAEGVMGRKKALDV